MCISLKLIRCTLSTHPCPRFARHPTVPARHGVGRGILATTANGSGVKTRVGHTAIGVRATTDGKTSSDSARSGTTACACSTVWTDCVDGDEVGRQRRVDMAGYDESWPPEAFSSRHDRKGPSRRNAAGARHRGHQEPPCQCNLVSRCGSVFVCQLSLSIAMSCVF